MPKTVLRTKLFIPPVQPSLVPRLRLIERLNQGHLIGRKLTLISAPAGFGKTTLVSAWVAGCERPVAWVSLDGGESDPTRFLAYLVAALQTLDLSAADGIAANIGKGVLAALESPQPPPTESILTILLNEISRCADNFIVVLDDYHAADAKPVGNILTFLLEHLPPQMHLVIATREDPDLPLARLRAQGHMSELRVGDLRFTHAETAGFLNQMMGLDLSEEEIGSLGNRTEGWIAGLQLAALSMRGHKDPTSFIKSFTGSHHFVLDYLVEEVLQQQPAGVQTFLLCTSILDRLCGPLCDAVLGRDTGLQIAPSSSGQETLEYLDRANLFIVPLDTRRRWYRYHHLFADLLNHRLRQSFPEQISEFHRRASAWYEQKDLPADAIGHTIAAEDLERAADLAELAWPAMSGSIQSIEWLGWVRALPDELVRARPVLSVSYAWAFLNSGELEAAEAKLRDVERWLQLQADMNGPSSTKMVVVDEEQFRSLPTSLATARAYHAQATGDVSGTVKYARRVLDLLPKDDSQWRGDATALLALAYWTSGELVAAHRTLSEGLAVMGSLDVIVGTFVLADMTMTLGKIHEALRICEHALQLAAEQGEPMPLGTEDVYTGISALHRERGELESATQDLLAAKRLGEQVELPDWQYRWCIAQARLKETQGDLDGAFDLLNEAERLYVRTPLPKVRPIPALKARVWLAQGRLAEALGWARERGLSVDDDLCYLREFEHATLIRVLIAQYRSDPKIGSLHKAMGFVDRLLRAAEEGGRMGSAIEILVLQALGHEAQGNILSALVALERALTLAEPERYFRLFVDEGSPMFHLLSEADNQGIMPGYVGKLLAAFEAEEPKITDRSTLSSTQGLIEPLSQRELEVLQLVAEGLSNREISERLFLALNTVKGHNRNIFGKLEVQRRTEAVARARDLGLL